MLDLALFRDRTFAGANVLIVLSGYGIFGVYFFLSLYVQGVLGFSATKAGLVFAPMALLLTLLTPASQRLVERIGVGPTVGLGMATSAAGFVLLERVGGSASFLQLVPSVLVIGAGGGLTTPLTAAVLAAVPVERSGVASGILNTMRELAASLGIAVTGAIFAAREHAALASGAGRAAAFVDGYRTGVWVSVGVMAAGALVALLVLPARRPRPLVAADPTAAAA